MGRGRAVLDVWTAPHTGSEGPALTFLTSASSGHHLQVLTSLCPLLCPGVLGARGFLWLLVEPPVTLLCLLKDFNNLEQPQNIDCQRKPQTEGSGHIGVGAPASGFGGSELQQRTRLWS